MSQKAWMAAYTKGSQSMRSRLAKIHANNPEFQDFVKKHGFGGTLSAKQSEKQKKSSVTSVKPVTPSTPEANKNSSREALIRAAAEKIKARRQASANRVAFGGELGGGFQMPHSSFRRYSESWSVEKAKALKSFDDIGMTNYSVVKHKGKKVGDIHKDEDGWNALHHKSDKSWSNVESKMKAYALVRRYHEKHGNDVPAKKKLSQVEKLKASLAETKDQIGKPTPSAEEIAKKHNLPLEQIQAQIEKGIKVEKEHTDSESQAHEIARDHLDEFPDYYDRLDKMETQAKKDMKESVKNPLRRIQTPPQLPGPKGGFPVPAGKERVKDRWGFNAIRNINSKITEEDLPYLDGYITMARGGWVAKRNGTKIGPVVSTKKMAQSHIENTKKKIGAKFMHKLIAMKPRFAAESKANRERVASWDSAVVIKGGRMKSLTVDPKSRLNKLRQMARMGLRKVLATENTEMSSKEKLDELKKATLASYINKASKDAMVKHGLGKEFRRDAEWSHNKADKIAAVHDVDLDADAAEKVVQHRSMGDAENRLAQTFTKGARKRLKGVSVAAKKLAKEEKEEDSDEPGSGKYRDEWGRDTDEQDQWKKNVTGKRNKKNLKKEEVSPLISRAKELYKSRTAPLNEKNTDSHPKLWNTHALVHDSGKVLEKGATVKGFRGSYKIQGFEMPHHKGSTGRVYTDKGTFFPGVVNAKIVKRDVAMKENVVEEQIPEEIPVKTAAETYRAIREQKARAAAKRKDK